MRTASAFVLGASLNAQATARMVRFGGASIWKQAGLPIRPPHHIHELVDLASAKDGVRLCELRTVVHAEDFVLVIGEGGEHG